MFIGDVQGFSADALHIVYRAVYDGFVCMSAAVCHIVLKRQMQQLLQGGLTAFCSLQRQAAQPHADRQGRSSELLQYHIDPPFFLLCLGR